MKRLTPTQIRQIYDQGPDAVVDLVTQLFDIIDRLESEVHALKARGAELERQVHRNSHNSSQPPSADGLKKPPPKSQRRPSGRLRGGQPVVLCQVHGHVKFAAMSNTWNAFHPLG